MKRTIIIGLISMTFIATPKASDLIHINQKAFDRLESVEYEVYDSGYAEWLAGDIELFISDDENFSVGVWKARAGSEMIDTLYPYNVFFILKKGQIKTKSNTGLVNSFDAGEGFLIPKDWMGMFELTQDVELIYLYDGLVKTENDDSRDVYKDASVHFNKDIILKTLAKKNFTKGEGLLNTKEELIFNNKDDSFSIGTWESKDGSVFSQWPYDEFMYVISGQILMTDKNGIRTVIDPNEGIVVPAGWEGDFSVPNNVVKIWSIYDK